MIRYLTQRLLYGLLVMYGVITVVFFLFNVLPGDPARMLLGQREDEEVLQQIRQKLGFDQPLYKQYFYYLNDLSPLSFHENEDATAYTFVNERYNGFELVEIGSTSVLLKKPFLRFSFQNQGLRVSKVISETLPNTFVLAVSAITIAMVLGIFLGCVSAVYKDSWLDRFLAVFGALGMSLPSFFAAIIIAWLFGFVWNQYTGLNMTGSLYTVDDYGRGEYLSLKNLLLPAITLGIRPLSVIIQLTRNSMLDVMQMDFIRTARAKGLSERKVLFRHALPNALNPVITAASGWFASMLAGAVFVEYIFGWNGIGKRIVEALNTLDLPIVMGSVLIIALMFVVINILVDIIYGWLDPRVRISANK